MIRYPVTPEELRTRIEAASPGWLAEAAKRTRSFRRARRYNEKEGIWVRVKSVYAKVQHHKCAYCERRLAADDFGGSIEQDVDHYRPKRGVREWPTPDIVRERKISYRFTTGGPFPEGYYLLAYHCLNYALACKKCNTPLKSCFFPIAGERGPQADDPAELRGEQPFLIYPLGDEDDDPEKVLGFDGILPVAKSRRGLRRRRTQVIIDFFALDQREELRHGRAEAIRNVYQCLELWESGTGAVRKEADRALQTLLSPAAEHTSCARAFREVHRLDRVRADAIYQGVMKYLESQSP